MTPHFSRLTIMMSGLDGSGAVHTVLTWEAFGGHVPPGGSEMYWFDQSYSIIYFKKIHASGTQINNVWCKMHLGVSSVQG